MLKIFHIGGSEDLIGCKSTEVHFVPDGWQPAWQGCPADLPWSLGDLSPSGIQELSLAGLCLLHLLVYELVTSELPGKFQGSTLDNLMN